jgi:hypothetical protein
MENNININIDENILNIHFSIHNKYKNIASLINVNLFKLLYTLNDDFYENYQIYNDTNDKFNSVILLKHFFKDLGISQKYIHIELLTANKNNNNSNIITFDINTIYNTQNIDNLININNDIELIHIKNGKCMCNILNDNTIQIHIQMCMDNNDIPKYLINIIKNIINKILNRIIYFIQNM